MKKLVLLSAITLSSFLVSMEKENTHVPSLPPEIHWKIIKKIIHVASKTSDALNTLGNYECSHKMAADLINQNKVKIENRLKRKFGHEELELYNLEDPAIKEKALYVLKNKKKQTSLRLLGVHKWLDVAIADIEQQKIDLDREQIFQNYLDLLYEATRDNNVSLATIALEGINRHYLSHVSITYPIAMQTYIETIGTAHLNIKERQLLNTLMQTGKKFGLTRRAEYSEIFRIAKQINNTEVMDYLCSLDLDEDDVVEPVKKKLKSWQYDSDHERFDSEHPLRPFFLFIPFIPKNKQSLDNSKI
jgi:hypothetical protein